MRRAISILATVVLLAVAAGCGGGQTTSPADSTPLVGATSTAPAIPTVRPTTAPGQAACRTAPSVIQTLPPLDELPPVTDQDHVRGPADAAVTMIEYADFQ